VTATAVPAPAPPTPEQQEALALAQKLVAGMPAPQETKVALLRPLAGAVLAGMRQERQRIRQIIEEGRVAHLKLKNETEGGIAMALMGHDERTAALLGEQRQRAIITVQIFAMALRAIDMPIGMCPQCEGARVVPSSLVLPGGQPSLSPCPNCTTAPSHHNGTVPA
jgi:hypothetical protein